MIYADQRWIGDHGIGRFARHVLAAAMQDFIDEVRPVNTDDWLTLVRAARGVARERLEDYIAAAAADGPLIPDSGPGSHRH